MWNTIYTILYQYEFYVSLRLSTHDNGEKISILLTLTFTKLLKGLQ